MASANLVFDILANDHASSKFDRIGRSASGATGPLSSMTGKLKTLAKWGAAAAVVAGAFAIKMGVDAVKAAAADEQAQVKLAGQLKRSAGAHQAAVDGAEAFISKMSLATGVADDDLRPALARLATATGDVDKAQSLLSLAMDVSAGTGKSLESVSTALMKAQNGQVSSLARLGIKTKDAEGNTLSFTEAVKGMTKQFGGASAEAADTYQGKMDRLKVTWEETKEALGAKLLPVLTQFGGWLLNKGIPGIKRFWDAFTSGEGPIGKFVGWFRNDLGPALQRVGEDLMPTLRSAWASLKEGFKEAQPVLRRIGQVFVDYIVPAMGKLAEWAIPQLVAGFRRMVKVINFVYDAIRFLWNNGFGPAFQALLEITGRVIQKFGQMLSVVGSLPGAPKWMSDAGDKLQRMGQEAIDASQKIKAIPKRVQTEYTFHTTYTYSGLAPSGGGGVGPTRGRDDDYSPRTSTGGSRGKTMTGSRGRMALPGAGSDLASSLRAALDGASLVLVGADGVGQRVYLRTGGI